MSRVEHALSQLVRSFLPASSDEDDDETTSEQRHDQNLKLARSILKNEAVEPPENDHISDMIKKKLWRDNDVPDKAVRYSNLYSKLLTLPVINHKWAILYLLHQVAGQASENVHASEAPQPYHTEGRSFPDGLHQAFESTADQDEEEQNTVMNDAFPPASLSRQPPRQTNRDGIHQDDVDPNGIIGREEEVHQRTPSIASPTKDMALSKQNQMAKGPSESTLLRDLPFTLQGLSSTNLQFGSMSSLSLPPNLPLPLISLLHTLAEPSLLYRNLSEFVQSKDEGLIGQSLRSAISSELRSYLGLIATLEGEIRRAIASGKDDLPQSGVTKARVTLKRCVIWTREATLGLRLMSLMAEKSQNLKGGQLIAMIHSFSASYGDPFVGAFAERTLAHMTRPFYTMLRHWIYDGELSDPYLEFFVIEQDAERIGGKELEPRKVPASSVWQDKYKLSDQAVPSIITEDFAKKVFLIGKSLNFIRYGCGDSAWVEAYSKDESKELHYGDTATLETSIDQAYKTTMARLIHLMNDPFKLFDHLNALKKYLLLGQGDFIVVLMESLSSYLDRPAGSQYRHTLTGQLEHAIRGSNAQYDSPDVLRRLDARLLELSHGEIGWDVFTLEYRVDAPVDVVITPWANKQYLVLFNFLWRIKRVEYALGTTWRRCMTGARGILASVSDKLGRDWKTARCCIAEMIHFVNQLQYYILFEVIEASWDKLQTSIARPNCTLDDLIGAHTKYLQDIIHKGLLGSTKSSITGTREDSFTSQLHYILKVMLAYKDAVDGLYSFSVAEFTRRQELAAKIETRTAQGKWGITEKDEDDSSSPVLGDRIAKGKHIARDTDSPVPNSALTGDDHMLPSLRNRLHDLSADFRYKLNTLLGDLLAQPDVDMKFLGVVMNFNDVYHPRKRKVQAGREKKTPSERSKETVVAEKGKEPQKAPLERSRETEKAPSDRTMATERSKESERSKETMRGKGAEKANEGTRRK